MAALLARFYDPELGDIEIDGQEIRNVTLQSVRDAIGYVFQETYLFSDTVARNIAYSDKDLGVVDFSNLDSKEKRTALEAANTARCTCGCGMTLAQCVATDSTCPLRVGNIERIKGMVAQAHTP
jgi:ABC-type sugar transport system ATPase subunit